MLILVSYDVSTTSKEGRRRLRRVARACKDYGTRVQYSVFECHVQDKEWLQLRHKLLGLIDPSEDSLRFYFLGEDYARRTEHHGLRPSFEPTDPLIL